MSPGRWDVDLRWFPNSQSWMDLRASLRAIILEAAGGEAALDRECFAMATGEEGCKLARDEALRDRILRAMEEFCRMEGAEGEVLRIAEGQPFRLELMRLLLASAGDGDCEFLALAESGFPLGVKNPLPRTPLAFERQVEWSLKYDPMVACLMRSPTTPPQKTMRPI